MVDKQALKSEVGTVGDVLTFHELAEGAQYGIPTEEGKTVWPVADNFRTAHLVTDYYRNNPGQRRRPVVLINLSFKTYGFKAPQGRMMEGTTKEIYSQVTVKPFELLPPIRLDYAVQLLRADKHDNKGGGTHQTRQLAILPPAGDCKRKQSFFDKRYGKEFSTCCFAPCKFHGAQSFPDGPALHHSILQAQHLGASMLTPEAIERYISEVDPRTEVAYYLQRVISKRRDDIRQRQGFGVGDRASRRATF